LERVVAVMQPYFYPYAGYFRLLAAANTFVVFDDVQFPRRGRVHRCEIPGPDGAARWLTLPLAPAPRDALITELAFARDARSTFDARLQRLPWLMNGRGPLADRTRTHVFGALDTPAAFVEAGLRLVAETLRLPARFIRSSELAVDSSLRGYERVIAVVEAAGGTVYVNAPGGRALYEPRDFDRHGITLRFLEPYRGRYPYLLRALVEGDPGSLRADIVAGTQLSA
jgi:WbqC-like protein